MATDIPDGNAGKRSIKSAERALDLLEFVAAESGRATFKAIGSGLDLPKSSLHGLLEVLVSRSYLSLDEQSRAYSLGIRALELGEAYRAQHSVTKAAQPILEAIVAAANETTHLAELSGTQNVYLAKVDSHHALRMQSDVGTRRPAHSTGVGKALLAQLDDAEIIRRFGDGALPTYTPTTIGTVPALQTELAATRQRGFAFDNEEGTPGIFCLAVPVYGAEPAILALSVAVPITRANPAALSAILMLLADASCKLAAQLGAARSATQLSLTTPQTAQAAIAALIGEHGAAFSFMRD
ncbi:IclR family transcriptional regulator [Devosia limi]|uniref:Transcriptional regulator, IclR family n=1 Tax=Devosia limi DSM 17137 TaxID=1121477 RepID=A0A1M5E9P9_9HYPH|nr:IclR family transcriptional regulator [Devosia limi]SHF75937.1 transcriptional regulator, IclR family [Devosia limi DSM 17137]